MFNIISKQKGQPLYKPHCTVITQYHDDIMDQISECYVKLWFIVKSHNQMSDEKVEFIVSHILTSFCIIINVIRLVTHYHLTYC